MANKNSILSFNIFINKLYSINYSCLRVAEQRKIQIDAENFKFKMPNQKTESWADAKMNELIGYRSNFFEYYNEANNETTQAFAGLDRDLENIKNALHAIHNIWFDKTGSFEDIFDGFVCKSPELLELICIFEMQPFMTNNQSIMKLTEVYAAYIEKLFFKTITQSMLDIVDQLNNDFNSNGTPSLYKGIIKKDNVTTISAEKLKSLRKQLEEKNKQIQSIKTKKYSGLSYTQNMAHNKYLELDIFLTQIESRIKSANTDFDNTLSSKIIDAAMDYLTGIKTEKRPVVNEVYVTQLELSYISYLSEMMDYAYMCLTENSNQHKKEGAQMS